jgi:hypothetical protein
MTADQTRRAFWSRRPAAAATDICFWQGCGEPARQQTDERWRGRYCARHIAALRVSAERGVETMSERVLIYGSRNWTDSNAIRNAVHELPRDAVVIHGGAKGADTLAGQWAKANGMKVEIYRAAWTKHGRAAGPIRNQQMIDEGKPTRAIGFRSAGVSNGTDDMTERLVASGIPHEVVQE